MFTKTPLLRGVLKVLFFWSLTNPILSVTLLQRKSGNPEYYLLLVFARVIGDFWSACLFANHLCVVYTHLEKNVPPEAIKIVDPKLTYQHLAAQEREAFVRNPELPFRLFQYWESLSVEDKGGERHLARVARVPAQPSDEKPEFKFKSIKLVQRLVRQFRERLVLPKHHTIDEFEIGQILSLSAFDFLLSNVTKTNDFVFGYNVSIRESYPAATFGFLGH